jgi:CelD/BcsL family acetyltransferase involved in cellulose biosynthesis
MGEDEARIEIITDDASFRALQPAWDTLWSSVDGEHHESFDVCWLAWTEVARPQGRQLRLLVVREHGELMLVWPMISHRTMRCTVFRPLGPGTADYTVLLVRHGLDRAAWIERAWRAHLRFARPDLSYLPYLPDGSALEAFAARLPRVVAVEADRGALARLSQQADWPSFCRQVGAFDGRKPGALERRLAKEGKLALRIMGAGDEGGAELAELVDWTLARKREWASRAGKDGPWLRSSQYRDYLLQLLTPGARATRGLMFVVTLDGQPLATSVIGLGKSRVIGLINGFDLGQARFGPGKLSLEYVMKWALEQQLDVDFGVGVEKYKAYWAEEHWVHLTSYEYTNTAWGWTARRAKQGVRELRSRLARLAHKEGLEAPTGPGEQAGKGRTTSAAGAAPSA